MKPHRIKHEVEPEAPGVLSSDVRSQLALVSIPPLVAGPEEDFLGPTGEGKGHALIALEAKVALEVVNTGRPVGQYAVKVVVIQVIREALTDHLDDCVGVALALLKAQIPIDRIILMVNRKGDPLVNDLEVQVKLPLGPEVGPFLHRGHLLLQIPLRGFITRRCVVKRNHHSDEF